MNNDTTPEPKEFIPGPIQGIVTSIRIGRTRTYYAVVDVDDDEFKGSVTFSLVPNIWKAKEVWPQPGTVVVLRKIRWHTSGNNSSGSSGSSKHSPGKQGGWRAKDVTFNNEKLRALYN